jgi:Methyltransferase FkbM domain
MKIDIEGYEHRAFSHSDKLLSEVQVAYIFMEWTRMRDYHGSEVDDSDDKRLVQRLVDQLATGLQYTVYGVNDLQQLDPRFWYGWPNDIVWVHKEAISPSELLGIEGIK